MNKRRKKYLVIVLAVTFILATSLMVLRGLWFGECDVDSWSRGHFEAAAWQAAVSNERYFFVRDILDLGRFLGGGRESIVAALGPPDYASPDNSPDRKYITYIVRTFDGGCFMDSIALLHLQFDGTDRVVSEWVRFD